MLWRAGWACQTVRLRQNETLHGFIDACAGAGTSWNADFNGADQEGVGVPADERQR